MAAGRVRIAAAVIAATGTLNAARAPDADAHAHVSPSIVQTGHSETYTLVVPSEGTATTSSVELTVPQGFQVGSFEAEPGWKRTVRQTGSGDEAVVSEVAWTGGRVREGEAAYLRFQGSSDRSGDYAFKVRQTYSDGKVVDWTGPASSEAPAPVVTVADSVEGSGGGLRATAALILAILALLLSVGALVLRPGRPLT